MVLDVLVHFRDRRVILYVLRMKIATSKLDSDSLCAKGLAGDAGPDGYAGPPGFPGK